MIIVLIVDVIAVLALVAVGLVGEYIKAQRAQAFGAVALNQNLRIIGEDEDNSFVTNESWNQSIQMHISTVYVAGDTVHLYGWLIVKPSYPDCAMDTAPLLTKNAVSVVWKCGKYFWPKTYVNLVPVLDGFAGTNVVLHPITVTYP